jgi:hypothetical protein
MGKLKDMQERITPKEIADPERIRLVINQLKDYKSEIDKQIDKYEDILKGQDYNEAVGRGTLAFIFFGSTPSDGESHVKNGYFSSGFADCDLGIACAAINELFEKFPESLEEFVKVKGPLFVLKVVKALNNQK